MRALALAQAPQVPEGLVRGLVDDARSLLTADFLSGTQ